MLRAHSAAIALALWSLSPPVKAFRPSDYEWTAQLENVRIQSTPYHTVATATKCETPTNYANCTWTFYSAEIDEATRVCVDKRCTTIKELSEWLKEQHK